MKNGEILTSEQIAAFKRDGFLHVPAMYSAQEVAEYTAWTTELQNRAEEPGQQMMYFEESGKEPGKRILNRIEAFTSYHDGFKKMLREGKLRQACGDLFASDAVLFKDKINFKQPGGDGFEPHQDQQAGWDRYAPHFISVMICVDEATVENGCLEIVAGFHHTGLVGNEWAPLTEEQVSGINFVHYPTKPGDIVFFDTYAPHRSAPNMSDKPRRLIFATYGMQSEGDHREQYYIDKRNEFPPDCEREDGKSYAFRV